MFPITTVGIVPNGLVHVSVFMICFSLPVTLYSRCRPWAAKAFLTDLLLSYSLSYCFIHREQSIKHSGLRLNSKESSGFLSSLSDVPDSIFIDMHSISSIVSCHILKNEHCFTHLRIRAAYFSELHWNPDSYAPFIRHQVFALLLHVIV